MEGKALEEEAVGGCSIEGGPSREGRESGAVVAVYMGSFWDTDFYLNPKQILIAY